MDKTNNSSFSIKQKLLTLVLAAVIPLLMVTLFLVYSLLDYSKTYDAIVNNLTVANDFNISFKENMDESLYKLVVGYVTFDNIDNDSSLKNPYTQIREFRNEIYSLQNNIDANSRVWLSSLLRNIDTLEKRINDIKDNLQTGDQYDANIQMLNDDIYILTDLIQDDIQYFIYYQTINIENLQKVLNSKIQVFVVFWIVLGAIIVTSIIIFAGSIVKNITEPLADLCEVTDQIANGDFNIKTNIETDDEITVLAHAVNDMSNHLEIMVDHIKEDERKMRYAELRLLQEQINPHFLYNTLDAIVWLIEVERNEEAINMVMSLSKFFRLVLSKGKEFITIKDEEQHIRSYLEIQQVRYREILDYNIHIDAELYDYAILKMTLQPIVENSLYHGIKCKRSKGLIDVSGYIENDKIVLVIKDDGVGMDMNTLERLRSDIQRPCKETQAGFGLANVNERIHINFGYEYGMIIDSEEKIGTTIKIELPAIKMSNQEVIKNEQV